MGLFEINLQPFVAILFPYINKTYIVVKYIFTYTWISYWSKCLQMSYSCMHLILPLNYSELIYQTLGKATFVQFGKLSKNSKDFLFVLQRN